MPNNRLSPSITAKKIKDINAAMRNIVDVKCGQVVRIIVNYENGKHSKKIITGKVVFVGDHNIIVQTYFDTAFKKDKYKESIKKKDLYDKSVELHILGREAS